MKIIAQLCHKYNKLTRNMIQVDIFGDVYDWVLGFTSPNYIYYSTAQALP